VEKISFADYVELSSDLKNREKFKAYSTVVRGRGGFDFRIVPNPELVVMTAEEVELENAMAIGNESERIARKIAYTWDRILSPGKPVIVSEGDSWFQFPLLIDEVIDHLNDDYAILSLGAAGDTAQNMVFGPQGEHHTEYMSVLHALRNSVKAFLFSAAGNDIIGEDPATNRSALVDILNPYSGDTNDVAGHINETVLAKRLADIGAAYSKVISDVRADPDLAGLPILFHGYDYPYPYPWGAGDPRNPIYARNDEWLGEAFAAKGFPHATEAERNLRRSILKALINRLYTLLEGLAGNPDQSRIWVVDCRGALEHLGDWNDEIHGTSAGFAKVAARFQDTLTGALAGV